MSDIGLDDISFTQGACGQGESKAIFILSRRVKEGVREETF